MTALASSAARNGSDSYDEPQNGKTGGHATRAQAHELTSLRLTIITDNTGTKRSTIHAQITTLG